MLIKKLIKRIHQNSRNKWTETLYQDYLLKQ